MYIVFLKYFFEKVNFEKNNKIADDKFSEGPLVQNLEISCRGSGGPVQSCQSSAAVIHTEFCSVCMLYSSMSTEKVQK